MQEVSCFCVQYYSLPLINFDLSLEEKKNEMGTSSDHHYNTTNSFMHINYLKHYNFIEVLFPMAIAS